MLTFPQKLAENIWVLGHSLFHSYLVRGKKFSALFEMGMSATADALISQLSNLGVCPDYLIVSHPHSDHVCGLAALKKAFPSAAIIAGEGAEEFLAHPKGAAALIHEDRHVAKGLARLGVVSRQSPITAAPTLSGCLAVPDGKKLDLGGTEIVFLEAKGHSPGNIVVHVPAVDILLAADSLGNLYIQGGFFPIFFTGYNDYLATIRLLQAVNPAMVGLAHSGLYTNTPDVQKAFADSIACAEQARDRILNDAREDEAVAQDIFQYYYHDELAVFSPENIIGCCRLLVRRVREIQ